MKKLVFVLFCLMGLIINRTEAKTKESDSIQHFFIGTYTDGDSKGIYRASLNISNGKLSFPELVATSNDPSYIALTKDQKYLLAVNETTDKTGNKNGFIESFSISDDGAHLNRLSKVSSGGAHPAYVSVNAEGFVLAANYTGGSVALLHIDNQGQLKLEDVQQHYGNGPVKDRQEAPHVHSAFFEPGSDRIFVADLGTDQIAVYRLDNTNHKLIPATIPKIKIAPGSGPRHLAFHPQKKILYVANELSNTVSVISLKNNGSFNEIETVSALPKDYHGQNTIADIHISRDGHFLYVSNRGLNSIAVFEVNSANGNLKLLAEESTRGQNPRNFTLSSEDQFLLAANQTSQNIVAFRRDSKTGRLTFTDEIKAFMPVCLLFQK